MAEIPKVRTELSEKLSLFIPDYVSDTVVSSVMEDQLPIGFSTTNQTNPIRFYVRGTDHWIDFEKSYFEIEGTIEGTDGDATSPLDAATTTHFSLTNNFLHNLFSSIHVNVQNSPVTFSNDNYPYIAYIQNLLNYNNDFMEMYSDLFLWSKDTAGQMSLFGKSQTNNKGAQHRKNWIAPGNKVYGILKLQSPVFLMQQYLLNYVDVDIVLNRNDNPAFYFMMNVGGNFKFRLDSIIFRVRKVKLSDEYNSGVARMFQQGENIPYPLGNNVVFTKTYSGYGTDSIEDNLFQGKLPSRVVFGIVSNKAYTGTSTMNPFNFEHKDLIEVGLFVNGMAHPIPMTPMDFTARKTHRMYHYVLESMQSTNPHKTSDALAISKEEFDKGFTLFSFDMSSDQYGGLNQNTLSSNPANVRLHLRFKSGQMTEQITLIVYYEVTSRMLVAPGLVVVPVK